jgi:hypothetical protein
MPHMAIYAKRLNGRQRKALKAFEALTGWEPIGQEDYDAGEYDFAELWAMNVKLLYDTYSDVVNIDIRGT